ncbi:MAG: RagB/SusD family nutrient uptake outer membrane protein [Bacteroidales bacterium]
MKTLIKGLFVCLIASVSLLPSCEDKLDEDLRNQLGPDQLFSTPDGFEDALFGAYSIARDEWAWNIVGTLTYDPMFAGTDIAYAQNRFESPETWPLERFNDNLNSSYAVSKRYWYWGYELVSNTSEIITKCGEVSPDVWDSPEQALKVEAEARFLRAYAYQWLAYLFKDVPLVDQIYREYKTDFTRQPQDSILQFVVYDLEFAQANLLDEPTFTGQIVKAAAKHKLAEVYLTYGTAVYDPERAEELTLEVIKSGNYELVKERFGTQVDSPGDLFSDMFKEGNQNISPENIWVMQLEQNVPGGGDEWVDWSRRTWVQAYGDISGMVLCDSLGGRGLGQMRPMQSWLNSYEDDDIRASAYNIRRCYWYNDSTKKETYGKEVNVTQTMIEEGKMGPTTTKMDYGITEISPGWVGNHKDRIKIRLAETYLLLAEACVRQGEYADAAAAINEVRSRAGAMPITAAQATMDYVLDERARELFAEYPRRLTLVRTDMLLERVKKFNEISAPLIQSYHKYIPIPQAVIDANTGADFPQNEGYN